MSQDETVKQPQLALVQSADVPAGTTHKTLSEAQQTLLGDALRFRDLSQQYANHQSGMHEHKAQMAQVSMAIFTDIVRNSMAHFVGKHLGLPNVLETLEPKFKTAEAAAFKIIDLLNKTNQDTYKRFIDSTLETPEYTVFMTNLRAGMDELLAKVGLTEVELAQVATSAEAKNFLEQRRKQTMHSIQNTANTLGITTDEEALKAALANGAPSLNDNQR